MRNRTPATANIESAPLSSRERVTWPRSRAFAGVAVSLVRSCFESAMVFNRAR
jgi:hypothetical protein